MGDKGQEGGESQVEIWKIKRVSLHCCFLLQSCIELTTTSLLQLIKALEEARGNGTSMISLIMPPKDQVCLHAPQNPMLNFMVQVAGAVQN